MLNYLEVISNFKLNKIFIIFSTTNNYYTKRTIVCLQNFSTFYKNLSPKTNTLSNILFHHTIN